MDAEIRKLLYHYYKKRTLEANQTLIETKKELELKE